MFAALQKLFSWLFGHAIIDGVSDAFKSGGKKAVEDGMNKLNRKDLLMGVINARMALRPEGFDDKALKEGIRGLNKFYASIRGKEKRDLFEVLFYRDVLDAIQEDIARQKTSVKEVISDPKTGKTVKTVYATASDEERTMHQTYLALVGLSGPVEIRLEMRRLNQSSPLARAFGKLKGATEGTGDNASRLLSAFLNGLGGK